MGGFWDDDDEDLTLVDFTDEVRGQGFAKAAAAGSVPTDVFYTNRMAAPAQKQGTSCPKCGKPLGKGGHFHVKACKG